MADEIKQVMGIDASQALDALKQLDQGYQSFESRLAAVARDFDSFNKQAGRTVAALKQISSAAKEANTALGKVDTSNATATAAAPQQARQSPQKLLTGLDAENAFNKLLGQPLQQSQQQVQQAASNVITQIGNIRTAANGNLAQAAQSVQKFTITWETLSRVVVTQFIVRTMSQIRDVISEATQSAVQFQRQVALIQTIADGASFGQIADEVRKISDNFNIPLLETAKGVYQALSNQVGDFGETVTFTEEAAKFAKATNSSLADSVDLLSGALRSYGLTVEDTGKVSGIFFTAIDKGRVTAEQLANSFGRVGPAAKEIGISLEELAAAAATISDKGTGTSETLTQFRGIITALTKPTDEMKKKLGDLGFTSSEAAIGTLGLAGTLRALSNSTDGTAQSFAKLFPNVRGIGGALSLTGANLETFARNIELAQQNGENFAHSKFLQATSTDAEIVTKELNKLSNALTLEFGQAVLTSGKSFIEITGGAETFTGVIKVLTPTLLTAIEAVGAGVIALGAFKIATIAAAGPVGVLSTALAALALAVPAALKAIENARTQNAFKNVSAAELESEKIIEAAENEARAKLDAAKSADQKIVQSGLQRVQQINRQYITDVNNAKSLNAALVADTERALDRIVSARQKFADELNSGIAQSQEQIRESLNRIQDIRFRQETRKFEFNSKDLNDAQQFARLTQRANELASRAEQQLTKAFQSGDKEARDRALSLFKEADAAALQAKAIGERTKNRAQEVSAFQQLEAIARKQIAAEERINDLQAQRQKNLDAERDRQEKIVTELREQAKVVLDNTGEFDKNGQQFSAADQAKRQEARLKALSRISELTLSAKDLKAADVLGLTQFLQSVQTDLQKRPLKLAFGVESNIQQVQASIRKSLSGIDVKLPFLQDLEQAVGRSLRDAPDQIRQAIQEVQTELATLRQQKSDQDILGLNVDRDRVELNQLFNDLGDLRQKFPANLISQALQPANQAIDGTITELRKMIDSGDISQARLKEIATTLGQLDFGSSTGALATQAKLLGDALAKVSQLGQDLQKQQLAPQVDEGRIQILQGILQSIQTSNPGGQMQTAAAAISNAVVPAGEIEIHALQTATFYAEAADSLSRLASIQLPAIPTATTAQFGRVMLKKLSASQYFQHGGVARGVDTIPVMAREGESFINPRSTRKFFSQIQAINAGQNPVFRPTSGDTTNIGDINITVKGGDTADQTVRSIALKLRRELRRGSSRL